MIESMDYVGGTRNYYLSGSDEFADIAQQIKKAFPDCRPERWSCVSDPYNHAVFGEEVISAALADTPSYFFIMDAPPVFCHKKFLLGSKRIYDKHYFWIDKKSCHYSLPTAANPVAKGITANIFGQPGDEDFSEYECIYFECNDHNEVERWCGHQLRRDVVTHYAVTYKGDELIRTKSYCYKSLEDNDSIGDWVRAWKSWAEYSGRDI